MEYKVGFSKKMYCISIILIIFAKIIFIFSGGVCINAIIKANPTSDHYSLGIFTLCFVLVIYLLLTLALIYIINIYKKQCDIYMEDKMCCIKKNKVLFEIEYRNIIAVKRRTLDSVLIFCKEPFIKRGINKGAKTCIRYYSKMDFHYMRMAILSKYYNVIFK